jgi:hypothetical protein
LIPGHRPGKPASQLPRSPESSFTQRLTFGV